MRNRMTIVGKTLGLLLMVLLGISGMASAQRSSLAITDGPRVEGVGDTWAVIAWTTNAGGSSIIRYGTNGNSLTQTAMSPYADDESRAHSTHRVKVTNLKPGTTYYFIADSGQGEGTGTEAKSPVQQFTTKAAGGNGRAEALKIIDGPRVEGVGDTWATIAWTTNTGASTVVRYGTNANSLTQNAQSPYADDESRQNQTHRVTVKNLQPGTAYYFMVDSGQGEGTGSEAKSQVQQFTTKASGGNGRAEALKITDGPRVEGVGNTWAVIAWTTNTGGSTIVRYGTSANSLNLTAEAPYTDNEGRQHQTHRVHVKNLQPNTAYYFIVDSGQGEGTGTETKSNVATFTTKAK